MSSTTTPTPGAVSYGIMRSECLDLLRSEPVGRICVLEHGFPVAFPVNYKLDDEGDKLRIVMRTAPETAIGRHRGSASLAVDRIALDDGRAWSVIVRGQLRPLLGTPGSVDPDPLLKTGRSCWMTLDIEAVSGRRFVVRRDAGEFAVEWQVEPATSRHPAR
jgi:hypothetical protein